MNYLYYPGCSADAAGKPYEESLKTVLKHLNVPFAELDGWNCCGATAYMAIDEVKAFALASRNLALAEKQAAGSGPVDLIAPCAACYLVLNKTNHYREEFPHIREQMDSALESIHLTYSGKVRMRHPLDVLVNDIGLDAVKKAVVRPLKGLKVACYYGCQIVRPYAEFDDQNYPHTMDDIVRALGAEALDWPLRTRCCGGTLSGTIQEVGLRLSYIVLQEAQKRGAQVIATACPLCQFNLECMQDYMNGHFEKKTDIPVAFFSQLLGMAFGLPDAQLGMKNLFKPLPQPAAPEAGGPHARA
jgi:heterodisulfide reductase subunit B